MELATCGPSILCPLHPPLRVRKQPPKTSTPFLECSEKKMRVPGVIAENMLSCRALMNRIGTRSKTIFGPSLAIALIVGVCVPGLAQSNAQREASFGNLKTSTPVAKLAGASTSVDKSSERKSVAGLPSLPADAQGPISAALGKDNSGYMVHPNANGLREKNLRQALVAEFTRRGVEVHSHNVRWGLETRGYGYGDALHTVKAVAPRANANRVEYRRNDITEWYENGPLGLEQGFTLAYPPGKATGEPLTLELALRGDLVAAVESTGTSLELRRKDGKVALRYAGLKARDATARELRSWLEVRGERLLLRVEDGEARYPVVVDPWIQQAELTATDGAAGDYFGESIAVSGNTVVVGAPQHTVGSNSTQGAAYVFVQSGGTWSQHAELTASDGGAFDEFGSSVAADGNTVVVGAGWRTVGSNNSQGAVYVFVESGGTWSQQAELTASDGGAYNYFGRSVALSGSMVVVGAPGYPTVGSNVAQGAAYVFTQSGTNWSQQAELTASDGVGYDQLGYSVAVSGSAALVGSPCHPAVGPCGPGAAYVFTQSGTSWIQQAELTASDGVPQDQFGWSVALDASTAVVGATLHTVGSNQSYQGAAYVFVESGGTWSQQAELSASDGVTQDKFGFSVALLGSTAVVTAAWHPYMAWCSCQGPGAAYVFVESGGTWSQQEELTASDGGGGDEFGWSVAMDGSTAVGAAPQHTVGSNQLQGAAYLFGSSGPAYTMSASPNSLNVAQGSQGTSTIMIAPENGFSGSVSLSASGLPSGVTAAFNPNPATGSSTLTLTASATATPDTATVRVIGTSGNLTQTTALALTVPPGPSYTVSASPNSLNVAQGSQGTSTIMIAPENGFSGSVSLSASGLPSGVTAAFNPNPATGSSTLTLTASATATTGTATVTVTGTSGNLAQTTTLTLTVTSGPNFTISANPTTVNILAPGQSGTTTLTFTAQNGFSSNGPVTINPACAGLPLETSCSSGASATIPVNGTATAMVTFTTTAASSFVPDWRGRMDIFGKWTMLEVVTLASFCWFSIFALCSARRQRRWVAGAMVVVACVLVAAIAGCGGGGGSNGGGGGGNPGTPAGTTLPAVSVTIGGVTQSVNITLTVQ